MYCKVLPLLFGRILLNGNMKITHPCSSLNVITHWFVYMWNLALTKERTLITDTCGIEFWINRGRYEGWRKLHKEELHNWHKVLVEELLTDYKNTLETRWLILCPAFSAYRKVIRESHWYSHLPNISISL